MSVPRRAGSSSRQRAVHRLTPLPLPDERCERDATTETPGESHDPVAAALTAAEVRSPAKKYPRLQTLPFLVEQHVAAMHQGDFIARSRLRWQQDLSGESDASRARRVSRESAAVVIQSAWRRSAAVRLRQRLIRGVWQRLMELAAWLSRDRVELRSLLQTVRAAHAHPLVATRDAMPQLCAQRLQTLVGAYVRLPGVLISTWICFVFRIRSSSRFLLRPAPAVFNAVYIPVIATCRSLVRLWRDVTQIAVLSIQSRVRAYLARCRYWKLLTIHQKTQAAIRLQCLYRAWVARRLVRRLRRRRAAVRIQCAWRCHRARLRVQHQRVSRCAAVFLAGVTIQAVETASHRIVFQAARQIQRVFRGQRTRAKIRVLVAKREQRTWHRNPSKGFALFSQQLYSQAAVYLERCLRQGTFEDTNEPNESAHGAAHVRPQTPLIPSGSRLAFSFSEAPVPLDNPIVIRDPQYNRRPATAPEGSNSSPGRSSSAQQVRFWHAFALSHWFTYEATGSLLHLRQAQVGFTACLRLPIGSGVSPLPVFAAQNDSSLWRLHARYCVVLCTRGSMNSKIDEILALCMEVLDELDVAMHTMTVDMHVVMTKWRNHLLMISAELYLEQQDYRASYAQLHVLLAERTHHPESQSHGEPEIELLLALMKMYVGNPDDIKTAGQHLRRCYQIVEMWAGVGFYHGQMSSTDAVAILQDQPTGSFLLHHEQLSGHSAKLLLKVKLGQNPCKVSSLRIHFEDGLYHMKKLPNCSHFSVHELIQQLPEAAGIHWSHGVQGSVLLDALTRSLRSGEASHIKARPLLLSWKHWSWRLTEPRAKHNECWSALCRIVAVRLEADEAFGMASFIAQDGLTTSRCHELRGELFFALGRSMANLHRRVESTLALQHAAIEAGARFSPNYVAICRSLSRRHGPQAESFTIRLQRVSKIERMCVKAWGFDSCSPFTKGRPFCEALLLQRIDNELNSMPAVVDTFFLRSLLRSHLKAFLDTDLGDDKHVELAMVCVKRLYERFADHSGDVDKRTWEFDWRRLLSRAPSKVTRPTSSLAFSINSLLLTWHLIPFQIAFEMAEVMYRSPVNGCETLADVYESLYGRLRSTKPRTWAYAGYEELCLVRLAFLYTQRSVNDGDERSVKKGIELMDELIAMRKMRALGPHIRAAVKRIQWPNPSSVKYPTQFSIAELSFVRGVLWERYSRFDRHDKNRPREQNAESKAWQDFDDLHRELLAMVTEDQQRARSASNSLKKLKGVRVFIGETRDVEISYVLHSKPFVVVQCEKNHSSTQHAATWMNQLSPAWNEFVEMDVASSKARLTIALMNRSRRPLGGGTEQVLGYVHVFIEELLGSTSAGQSRLYDLVSSGDSTASKRPRIRLGFQLVLQTATLVSKQKRRVHGHWDMAEVQSNLHGDVRRFVSSPWIWRWFGHQWLKDNEFCVAAWFLQRAIDESQDHSSVEFASDLAGLARCYRATMGRQASAQFTRPLLDQAYAIFQSAYDASGRSDLSLWKRLCAVHKLFDNESSPALTRELEKQIPASSNWVAMKRRDGKGIHYFNEDTGERFTGIDNEPNIREPLEWEDKNAAIDAEDPDRAFKPRRIVIMTTEMTARVKMLCRVQAERHASDPMEWIAVFNARKGVMQFVSLAVDKEPTTTTRMTTDQPVTYAMVADEFTMYHVLVVQDAYRKYQERRKHRRLLRGLLRSAIGFACERCAARKRLEDRAEATRRRSLNCLHVIVEKATKLRAMDFLTSDPYVSFQLVDGRGEVIATGKTTVRYHTVNPQWHEEFRLHYAFVDHEEQKTGADEDAVLRFEVYDYDSIDAFRQDRDNEAVARLMAAEENGDQATASNGTKKKYDFLGLAAVAVDPLVHGKCVTADLVLKDEDGYDDSPRPRGTLTVTAQWVHDKHVTQWRRNALKPALDVKPRKRALPKPHPPIAEYERVQEVWNDVETRVSDSLVIVEQLVRLQKRWKVAQRAGKTAEEAKLLEQRLIAALAPNQQFSARLTALRSNAKDAQATFDRFSETASAPIEVYIASCEAEVASAGKTKLEQALLAIRSARVGSDLELQEFSDINRFTESVGVVFEVQRLLLTWREGTRVLMEAFAPPVAAWEDTEDARAAQRQLDKLRALVGEASATVPTSLVSKPTSSASIPHAKPTTPTQDAVASSAASVSSASAKTPVSAAVARRLERIEREKRKPAKKTR